jgi:peroxiredoxin Q/BCP
MLQPGSKAPEFVLQNENGEDVALSDMLRTGPLVLYFYPADFTPGCTKEACTIRDMHNDILSVGLRVIGVSPQDGASHEKFRQKYDLPFSILSDPDKVAIKMYDVDGPFGVGVRRVTYLITQGAKIQGALQADVLINRHKEFIEKAIFLREAAGMKSSNEE